MPSMRCLVLLAVAAAASAFSPSSLPLRSTQLNKSSVHRPALRSDRLTHLSPKMAEDRVYSLADQVLSCACVMRCMTEVLTGGTSLLGRTVCACKGGEKRALLGYHDRV
eukprot:3933708-Rhodomonas_salina.4